MQDTKMLDCGLIVIGEKIDSLNLEILNNQLKNLEDRLKSKMKECNLDKISASKQILEDETSSLSMRLKVADKLNMELEFSTIENGEKVNITTNKVLEKTLNKVLTTTNLDQLEERLNNYIKQAAKALELGKNSVYLNEMNLEKGSR